uniref:Large ribosomal subunit protein eL33 n=1 Tax=Pseudodiaptomus poplesia TaxID=213370 RepID=A0A0U2UGB0_9MAXI|nr:60S ribosomal protein L35a [Pseudodiaptomus poplesia]
MAPKSGRLYAKAVFTGFKRGIRNPHETIAIVKVEGSSGQEDPRWYIAKKSVYLYKSKNKTSVPNSKEKSQLRCIWGKVTRPPGNAGSVRAKFPRNMPPQAMGCRPRIMLYPSRI